MRWYLALIFLILPILEAYPQASWCGSGRSAWSERQTMAADAIYRRAATPRLRSGPVDSIAVTIHIVEPSRQPGTTDFTIGDVERELEIVNQAFADAGLYFFICSSPRYPQGESVYNFTTGDELNRASYTPNTINIYFVEDLFSNNGQALCGYAEFPFVGRPEDRYIMMNKVCATDGATLVHEMGHFYGLFHTHETQFGKELVNRTNCKFAGDRFCDTPADPNLGNPNYLSGCNYIGLATDANGEVYLPPVSNFMSYAPADCQHFFTSQQENLMREVHLNENDYLVNNCDFYPDFALKQELDYLKIRSDEDLKVSYQLRQINAEQGYNVKLKISLANKLDEVGTFIHEERLLLQPGKSTFPLDFTLDFPIVKGSGTYFLKAFIDSDNEVIERTERNNNAITTIEVDNSGLGDGTIFPNPVTNELKIFLRSTEDMRSLYFRIYRSDGRKVWEDKSFKSQQEFFRILDVHFLPPGFYLLSLYFEQSGHSYTFKFFKQ